MRLTKDGRQYFTKVHEQAIIDYVKSTDSKTREKLYIQLIEPSLSEMVEKITFTYKFTSLPNIGSLKQECKVWLTTVLEKFDEKKGSKAFSYFSIVTKNWFIHKVKKNSQQNKREIQYEELPKDLEQKYFSTECEYMDFREVREFWNHFLGEVDKWTTNKKLKPNEVKVLEGVKILTESVNDIEIFNKKALYLYLREITGLSTKQIVNNLNKFRTKYREFKSRWDEGQI